MFKYRSELVLSKSWLNRALIIQKYGDPSFLDLQSDSEDVLVLKSALTDLKRSKTEFYLGQGGTSFRFFCFLVSRLPGEWTVKAHPRLFERPQKEIQNLFDQLGVEIRFNSNLVVIRSQGWKMPSFIFAEARQSSQFLSALFLNSWDLESDLTVHVQKPIVSEDYLIMTFKMLKSFGLKFQIDENVAEKKVRILRQQKPNLRVVQPEVDVSCAFSLCAAAVIGGSVDIENWNAHSIQPDAVFLKIFDLMNIHYLQSDTTLKIEKQSTWNGVQVNLNSSPDLFPVLAVLCALAQGVSDLSGVEQLQHKESDRLKKTKELLDLTGFRSELRTDGMKIFGQSSLAAKKQEIHFNPDHDHRMAMAAGLLKLAGHPIRIQTPEVVQKSYPGFWKDIGIQP